MVFVEERIRRQDKRSLDYQKAIKESEAVLCELEKAQSQALLCDRARALPYVVLSSPYPSFNLSAFCRSNAVNESWKNKACNCLIALANPALLLAAFTFSASRFTLSVVTCASARCTALPQNSAVRQTATKSFLLISFWF